MIEINLLPVREERRKTELQQQALILVGAVLGTIALVMVFNVSLNSRIARAAAHTGQLQNQIDQFKPQLEQVEAYRKTRAEIEQKLEVIEGLERQRSGPVRIMDELSIHTPERLWLTELETKGADISFSGMSLDNDFVALFMTGLNESAFFEVVELESTELREVDGLKLNSFKVNARLATPAQMGEAKATAGQPASAGRP